MIKVCDAIMGTGKSSAAITYLNEHPHDRFIYITPYLEEAARIKKGCPKLRFVEPNTSSPEYNHTKAGHTMALVKAGRNITTTHQAFKGYTPELLTYIKDRGYTLLIDENVDVLEKFDVNLDDFQLVLDAGYVREDNGIYTLVNHDYRGTAMKELFTMLKSRELIRFDDDSGVLYYWALPPELILAFKDVIVMTYLFPGQSLHHFFEMYHLPYEYIGIERTPDGGFRFGEAPGYTPEYVHTILDMIHILDNKKLNSIGNSWHALSMHWFETRTDEVEQLKNNISNCYKNIWDDAPMSSRLWGTYKDAFHKLKGKGYTNAFIPFNTKATNMYKNRSHLVYPVNIFMNVAEKRFYKVHGINVDEDLYALSTMVQWIWRSRIRDGMDIYIYIPSARMRQILYNWMLQLSKGGYSIE